MFVVEARVPNENLVGLPEIDATQATYTIHEYKELGVAYEAGGESAYTAAKRPKDYSDMRAIQNPFRLGESVRMRIATLTGPPPTFIRNRQNSTKFCQ